MAEINKTRPSERDGKRFWTSDVEAIIAIMVVLLILGMINVFSASFIFAEAEFDSPYFFLQRHLINVFVGAIAFGVTFYFDYHIWRKWIAIILIFTIISLIAVLIIGPVVNGARRWLPLVIFQFQPAEFAKLVSIMIAASYISLKVKKAQELDFFTVQMVIILIIAALTELEPDLGTASIILGIPILMLIVSGLDKNKILRLMGFGFVGVVLMILRAPYRLERLKITYDPWSDAQNYGYQTVQSLSAIGSGELTGMGLGVGVSKYDYLPEAHTDFAFAIFCQENGFLGAIFVFMLFSAFAFYAARIANRAKDEYGQSLAMGIMLLIVGQAIANMLMVGGMTPVVGIPLPFISYGGTSLIVTMASIGILVNVAKHGEHKPEKQQQT
ncbi:MAG: putative lipid II flippase FtsW [Selenomonadaceae bacterium]|nr:putative lipid II flippase FtsW [Selenomonadaceae bacterium]